MKSMSDFIKDTLKENPHATKIWVPVSKYIEIVGGKEVVRYNRIEVPVANGRLI